MAADEVHLAIKELFVKSLQPRVRLTTVASIPDTCFSVASRTREESRCTQAPLSQLSVSEYS